MNTAKTINRPDALTINGLARSYNALHYSQKLRDILGSVYPENNFHSYTKYELHKAINDTLSMHYRGEEMLKYFLIKDFFNRNVTAAFELKVNNSRVDFLTINGDTVSYEIKSSLDNLDKLAKQVDDYIKVFEYNNIVIDEKHLKSALEIIPDNYGIIIYRNQKKEVVRGAEKNIQLNPRLQLNLFTKKELEFFFKGFKNQKELIFETCSAEEINKGFKQMLKKRYKERWSFIKENQNQILPIDFHFFYHNNISPKLIYGIS